MPKSQPKRIGSRGPRPGTGQAMGPKRSAARKAAQLKRIPQDEAREKFGYRQLDFDQLDRICEGKVKRNDGVVMQGLKLKAEMGHSKPKQEHLVEVSNLSDAMDALDRRRREVEEQAKQQETETTTEGEGD